MTPNKPQPVCTWKERSYAYYISSCGVLWFVGGILKESQYNFCPKCGKPIEEVKYFDEFNDESESKWQPQNGTPNHANQPEASRMDTSNGITGRWVNKKLIISRSAKSVNYGTFGRKRMTNNMEIQYCPTCNQLTNHSNGICLKCNGGYDEANES